MRVPQRRRYSSHGSSAAQAFVSVCAREKELRITPETRALMESWWEGCRPEEEGKKENGLIFLPPCPCAAGQIPLGGHLPGAGVCTAAALRDRLRESSGCWAWIEGRAGAAASRLGPRPPGRSAVAAGGEAGGDTACSGRPGERRPPAGPQAAWDAAVPGGRRGPGVRRRAEGRAGPGGAAGRPPRCVGGSRRPVPSDRRPGGRRLAGRRRRERGGVAGVSAGAGLW